MDYYQDIKILPDPEFQTTILMNALFSKLHHVLAQFGSREIGISFPKMSKDKPILGNTLRLHGGAVALQGLQKNNWLTGMRDHVDVKEIAKVPSNCLHCHMKRIQVKSNAERLRRRYCKRHHGVTEQDVEALFPKAVEKSLALPYLQLKSGSTGQRFRLFVACFAPQPQPIVGEFNSYGLSVNATVPWF